MTILIYTIVYNSLLNEVYKPMNYQTDNTNTSILITAGDYPVHLAANIVPLDSNFDPLIDSLNRAGQLEAITLYKGEILDGRRRAISCKELGIAVREDDIFSTRGEMTDKELYDFVMAKNTRRNLSKAQMSMIAAFEVQKNSHSLMGVPLATEYAKKFWGVSQVTYKKARFILMNNRTYANEIFSTGFATIDGVRTSMSQTYDYLKKQSKELKFTGYDKGDPEIARLFTEFKAFLEYQKKLSNMDKISFVVNASLKEDN